jgi:hypothetical protein
MSAANYTRARRWALLLLLGGLGACQSAPSDAELLRLYLLGDELALINGRVAAANDGQLQSVRAAVAKEQNQPHDLAVLAQSTALRAETQQLVAYLRGLRQALHPGPQAPTLAQLADRRRVAAVLLDGGRADTLQRRFARYVAQLRPFFAPGEGPELGVGAADARVRAVGGAGPAGQSFGEFYFRDATVASALAVLAQQEAEVLRLEADVQTRLSQRVGTSADRFEAVRILATAESNTVAEGEPYRAELFLAITGLGSNLRMSADGRPLPVSRDGRGQVRFTAPPLPPGQARRRAYWDGTIAIRTNGRDSTFHLRVPYTIVRRQP